MYDDIRLNYGDAVTSQLFWLAPLSDEILDVVTSKTQGKMEVKLHEILAWVSLCKWPKPHTTNSTPGGRKLRYRLKRRFWGQSNVASATDERYF
jgi:hypothetical protein